MVNVHFSSRRQDWETPQALFDFAASKFGPFDIDVCATVENAKCQKFFSPDENGLSPECLWAGKCWMNPPYGREIKHWVAKAVDSVRAGVALRVVCLLPARTDTNWWHDYVLPFGDVMFLRGRVRFVGAKFNAPFPSAIVTFE